jgi:hypothetical protein
MSEALTKIVVDCATGQQSIVPLSAQEIAERDQMAAQAATDAAAREAEAERVAALKTSAKAKLVAGEPLTADEAAVLVL